MRICVINPFAGTESFGEDNLRAIASPDTEFQIVNIADRYPLKNNQWLYFKHSCTGPTIDRAIEAQREGFDAVFISCNLDIGLYECRQMLTIPVTATLESAAPVAHMMARRFSLLSVDDQNGQIQKMLLEQYQLAQGLVSVRSSTSTRMIYTSTAHLPKRRVNAYWPRRNNASSRTGPKC